MNIFKNPSWVNNKLLACKTVADLPEYIFAEINTGLNNLNSEKPDVSIVIPAWNEEVNIVRTIYSLSKAKTRYKTEIIVVNNNSTDRTQEMLNRLNVRSFFQPKAGCGPARQMGQENAKGKYVLMADADCYYPPLWIEKMVKALSETGVSCVYGRYSFFGTKDKPRWQLFLYEMLRDGVAEARHIKRPCINALGMSMGYVKELGLKTGFVDRKIRGEDGRMCFELLQLGKVKQVRDRSIRVWTLPRTLDKEGNLFYSVFARFVLELSRIKDYFYKQPVHDTHTSENYDPALMRRLKKFKAVHKEKENEAADLHHAEK
jgi:glycosyltransferase involved in cell wall biosynthesis